MALFVLSVFTGILANCVTINTAQNEHYYACYGEII